MINIKMRETGTPRSSQRTRQETPLIAMTNIKMRETGTPRSSQRARRETPARRDDKRQDARDGNALLVVMRKDKTHETGKPRSSQPFVTMMKKSRHTKRECLISL
jgi:hypothetical protein